jgi:hypothetical protein
VTTLDGVLPDLRHRITASQRIDASPDIVWNELIAVPMSALPFGFAFTALRHLPDVLARNERPLRGSDTFIDATPIPVVVSDEPRLLISAGVSQAWRIVGGLVGPHLDAEAFRAWNEPGWLKVAMSFELTPLDGGRSTLLATETRVATTDARSARAFGLYWSVIRGSSALIRREVVARVAGRAEAVRR